MMVLLKMRTVFGLKGVDINCSNSYVVLGAQ